MENVSVIIPAFNEQETIGNLVRDIRDLHPRFEVLVINDGSTDQTSEIVKKTGGVVLIEQENRGRAAASNSAWPTTCLMVPPSVPPPKTIISGRS